MSIIGWASHGVCIQGMSLQDSIANACITSYSMNSYDTTDSTVSSNRLIKRENGEIVLIPKSIAAVVGEKALRPAIESLSYLGAHMTSTLSSVTQYCWSVVQKINLPSLLPGAAAESLKEKEPPLRAWLDGLNVETVLEGHEGFLRSVSDRGVELYENEAYDSALMLFQKVWSSVEEIYESQHALSIQTINNLATVQYTLGKYNDAFTGFQRSLHLMKEKHGRKSREYAAILNWLGRVQLALGKCEEALALHQESLDIVRGKYGARRPCCATIVDDLGLAYLACGAYEQAREAFREALVINRELYLYRHAHTAYATTLHHLGKLHVAVGDCHQAQEYLHEALALRKEAYHTQHTLYAETLYELGKAYGISGESQQAWNLFQQALQIYQHVFGDTHPKIQAIRESLEYQGECMVFCKPQDVCLVPEHILMQGEER